MADFAFQPDGTYGELPYKVLDSGQIDVLIDGRIVRLKNVEQFIAIVSGLTFLATGNFQQNINRNQEEKPNEVTSEAGNTTLSPPVFSEKKARGGKVFLLIILVPIFLYLAVSFFSGGGATARKVVNLLNSEYGSVCNAMLEGWSSDTLKINWTSQTNKLSSIQIFSAVGTAKSLLYNDGVRYFKFPNDGGGYNVIDWKTGEKTSVSERAPYYFH